MRRRREPRTAYRTTKHTRSIKRARTGPLRSVLLASRGRRRAIRVRMHGGHSGHACDVPPLAVLFRTRPLHCTRLRAPLPEPSMRDCLAADARFGIVLIQRGFRSGGRRRAQHPGHPWRDHQGSRAARRAAGPGGEGEALIAVGRVVPDDPYRSRWCERRRPRRPRGHGPLVGAAGRKRVRRARALLAEQGVRATAGRPSWSRRRRRRRRPSWQLCARRPSNAYDAQRLLTADGAPERLWLLVELMEDLESTCTASARRVNGHCGARDRRARQHPLRHTDLCSAY